MTFTIEETVSVVITGDLTPSHRLKIQSLIKGEKLYISIHNQMITIDDVSEKDAYLTISVQIYVINTRSEKRIPITLTGNLLVHTPDVLNFKQHYIVTLCGSISGVVDCKVAPGLILFLLSIMENHPIHLKKVSLTQRAITTVTVITCLKSLKKGMTNHLCHATDELAVHNHVLLNTSNILVSFLYLHGVTPPLLHHIHFVMPILNILNCHRNGLCIPT